MHMIEDQAWRPAPGGRLVVSDGRGWVADTPGHRPGKAIPQLACAADRRFRSRIQVCLRCRPAPGCATSFALAHSGEYDLCFLAPNGDITTDTRIETARVAREEGGVLRLEATWTNLTDEIFIGLARPYRSTLTTTYAGTGSPQWELLSCSVEPLQQSEADSAGEPLVYVDVGAMGGLNPKWEGLKGNLRPVLFEPREDEARRIETDIRQRYPDALVLPTGLSDQDGSAPLFVTSAPSCTSMRRPDANVVSRYAIAEKFRVVERVEVPTARYETLYRSGLVPAPDVVKIDAQGVEYEILCGFGDLLKQVVAIELEAHFVKVYQGQHLISDISSMLSDYGFGLRVIRPNHPLGWNRELAEVNAFFLRRPGETLDAISGGRRKLRIAANVLDAWG